MTNLNITRKGEWLDVCMLMDMDANANNSPPRSRANDKTKNQRTKELVPKRMWRIYLHLYTRGDIMWYKMP